MTKPDRSSHPLAMMLAGLSLVAVAGCATLGAPMTKPSEPPSARPSFQTMSPLPSASPNPGTDTSVPPKYWAAILGDLAGRGAPTDEVALVSSRSVTWNDGSLGCPQPGTSYTQSLVDGMQVIVSVAGKQFDYRFGRSERPRLCERLR